MRAIALSFFFPSLFLSWKTIHADFPHLAPIFPTEYRLDAPFFFFLFLPPPPPLRGGIDENGPPTSPPFSPWRLVTTHSDSKARLFFPPSPFFPFPSFFFCRCDQQKRMRGAANPFSFPSSISFFSISDIHGQLACRLSLFLLPFPLPCAGKCRDTRIFPLFPPPGPPFRRFGTGTRNDRPAPFFSPHPPVE